MNEQQQVKDQKNLTFYSWIPNLTGSLNFEYISDNVVQDDNTHKLYQFTNSQFSKQFLYKDIDFSDGIEKNKKGLPRSIICLIEKEDDKLIGQYYEFVSRKTDLISKKLALQKIYENFEEMGISSYNLLRFKPNIHATFNIAFNGEIEIIFHTIDFIINDNDKNLSNIPLITYRAIKYILHKDVFHSEEDDNIVGIYPSKDNLKENILNNMLKYIKSYERLLKDSIKIYKELNWVRQDFYHRLINKTDGISSYMDSFNYIYECDTSTKYNYKINLSKNVIYSMKCMLDDLKNDFLDITWKKEIYAYSSVLLVSTGILFTGFLSSEMKQLENYLYLLLPFVFTIIFSAVVFKKYTIDRIAFNSYMGDVHRFPENFISKRLNNYSDHPNKIGKYSLRFGIGLIVVAVFSLIITHKEGIKQIIEIGYNFLFAL